MGKIVSLSAKNEEIKAKVKHFDFNPQLIAEPKKKFL
jgi:hypothetical protein